MNIDDVDEPSVEDADPTVGEAEDPTAAEIAVAEQEGMSDVAELAFGSRLPSIIESVIFAAGVPVSLRRLSDILKGPAIKEIKDAIATLEQHYSSSERGIHLVCIAGGWQFRTAPQNAEWVRAQLKEKPSRLGRASLETLAVIAYKQPATRTEIEAVRGVDADSAISSLLAKKLIKIAGRKEAVGRPLMYATTPEFLEVFGLKDLSELPALKEIGPVRENDDETLADDLETDSLDEGLGVGAITEDPEPGGSDLPSPGGTDDQSGASDSERKDSDGTGDEGGPEEGSHHD